RRQPDGNSRDLNLDNMVAIGQKPLISLLVDRAVQIDNMVIALAADFRQPGIFIHERDAPTRSKPVIECLRDVHHRYDKQQHSRNAQHGVRPPAIVSTYNYEQDDRGYGELKPDFSQQAIPGFGLAHMVSK